MTTLFYLMTILFIGYEAYVLVKTNNMCRFKDELVNFNRGNTVNTRFIIKAFYLSAVNMIYLVWAIVGLFSSSKLYFLFLIMLGLLAYLATRYSHKSQEVTIKRLDAGFSMVVLIYIFMNHFY